MIYFIFFLNFFTIDDAWIVFRGSVYNVTRYLQYHPGGVEELMRGAGRDCSELFNEIHPWVNAEGFLKTCFIGKLEDLSYDEGENGLLASGSTNKTYHKAKVLKIEQVSPDSTFLSFETSEKCRVTVGEHIKIKASFKGQGIFRPYTPISEENKEDGFDLLIKIYEDGKMTPILNKLRVGDTIDYVICENPGFLNEKALLELEHVGLVAGGTGITPMIKIIKKILTSETLSFHNTKISLLFSNRTEQDILLKSQLDEWQKLFPNNFRVTYTLTQNPSSISKDWKGETGRINEELLKKTMPPPSKKTRIFICGPPLLTSLVLSLLLSQPFNFDSETLYPFY